MAVFTPVPRYPKAALAGDASVGVGMAVGTVEDSAGLGGGGAGYGGDGVEAD